MQPLFSIVIANYNYGRFIAEAISSVTSQCGVPVKGEDGVSRLPLPSGELVELIICDAASTDNSVDVIRKYEDSIAWWCSEKDCGQSAAFNKGFSHATGRFLTWLNADDAFTPNALASIEQEIYAHPECEWFVGSSVWCDAEMRIDRCFCAHSFSHLRARTGGMTVGGPSSFFSPRLLNVVGGIDESLHYLMDADLWSKFYFQCGAVYRRTRANVWAFRQHEASKMSGADCATSERALRNRQRAQNEAVLMDVRYHRWRGMRRRLADIISFSPLDRFIAAMREMKFKGHSITELR